MHDLLEVPGHLAGELPAPCMHACLPAHAQARMFASAMQARMHSSAPTSGRRPWVRQWCGVRVGGLTACTCAGSGGRLGGGALQHGSQRVACRRRLGGVHQRLLRHTTMREWRVQGSTHAHMLNMLTTRLRHAEQKCGRPAVASAARSAAPSQPRQHQCMCTRVVGGDGLAQVHEAELALGGTGMRWRLPRLPGRQLTPTVSYMRRSALKPSGMPSMLLIARSLARICSRSRACSAWQHTIPACAARAAPHSKHAASSTTAKLSA